jgi:hypothetical protein
MRGERGHHEPHNPAPGPGQADERVLERYPRHLGTDPAAPPPHRSAMVVIMRRLLKAVLLGLACLVALFALAQLVPYGRTHANPAVVKEPPWDSPRTRELAVRACFDCHSNETKWPWYANVAPFSWVVEFDIENARDVINFSEWNRRFPLAVYSSQSILAGGMPTLKYRMAHPQANLNPQETRELASGLDATLGAR